MRTTIRAFTIVELLIVIVVIAIVAAITLVVYTGVQDRAKQAALQSDLVQAGTTLESIKLQNPGEAYPTVLPESIANGSNTYYSTFTSLTSTSAYCLTRSMDNVQYFITSANTEPTPGSCEGLVGWWRLNANANDSSGYGSSGAVNGPTPTTGQNGVANHAYAFDGVADYIDLPSSSILPSGLSNRTMCAWGNASALDGLRWMVAYGTPAAKQAMFVGQRDGSLYGGGYSSDAIATGYWTTGVWRHICLTYDGTTGRVYADGQQQATRTDAWNLVRSVFYIGRQVNGSQYWAGAIDDVRIYNRVLSVAEIQALYTAGAR